MVTVERNDDDLWENWITLGSGARPKHLWAGIACLLASSLPHFWSLFCDLLASVFHLCWSEKCSASLVAKYKDKLNLGRNCRIKLASREENWTWFASKLEIVLKFLIHSLTGGKPRGTGCPETHLWEGQICDVWSWTAFFKATIRHYSVHR